MPVWHRTSADGACGGRAAVLQIDVVRAPARLPQLCVTVPRLIPTPVAAADPGGFVAGSYFDR